MRSLRRVAAVALAAIARGTVDYCARGLRSSLGRRMVCCPGNCSHCDTSRCEAAEPACCPRVLASRDSRKCDGALDVACRYAWRASREGKAAAAVVAAAAASAAARVVGGASTPAVHVAIAGDKFQLVGTVACARSVARSSAAPARLRIHVVTDRESAAAAERALRCTMDAGVKARVVTFDGDATLRARGVTVRPIADERKASLAKSDLNYARFYLSTLLGVDAGVVVYLDSDVLVLGDVVALADATFRRSGGRGRAAAVAAVARPWKAVCGSFLNCKDNSSRAALAAEGLVPPYDALDAFNAGVLLVDVARWRADRVTDRVEAWIRAGKG